MIARRWLLLVAVVLAACGGGDRVIVGAGTTIVDSGFMEALETEYGRDISVVPGSTAELLELARQGAVDAVVVHDEQQELEYLAAHPDATRKEVFTSSFLLVGPAELVQSIPTDSITEAMTSIAAAGYTFVTRDDGSGTHSREMALWAQADVS
ncbi:MAG: hypothetical protein HKN91_17515, partial [Acidimicrobiia bacterium]|nr:hypothetical protein [Acidimicrobiia bacterium]